jgi:hypothetical protein
VCEDGLPLKLTVIKFEVYVKRGVHVVVKCGSVVGSWRWWQPVPLERHRVIYRSTTIWAQNIRFVYCHARPCNETGTADCDIEIMGWGGGWICNVSIVFFTAYFPVGFEWVCILAFQNNIQRFFTIFSFPRCEESDISYNCSDSLLLYMCFPRPSRPALGHIEGGGSLSRG